MFVFPEQCDPADLSKRNGNRQIRKREKDRRKEKKSNKRKQKRK